MNGEHKPSTGAAPPPDDEWMRLPDVLRMLGVGRTFWLDRVKSGDAPQPVRWGRATLWSRNEVQAFMAARVRVSRESRRARQ